jgi:hypothetical protein
MRLGSKHSPEVLAALSQKTPSVATFEGSSAAKAFAILRECSIADIAPLLMKLADAATGEKSELWRQAALLFRRLPRGRPEIYDDAQELQQIEFYLRTGHARSTDQAAEQACLAAGIDRDHPQHAAMRSRLAKKYGRRLKKNQRKISRQNID